MIFQNICFHNVEELVPFEDGWKMCRLPRAVLEQMNEGIRMTTAFYSTGVELRFRLRGEKAVLHLRCLPEAEAQVGYIYYGSFQGGWDHSTFAIGREDTAVQLVPNPKTSRLAELSRAAGFPFNPEMLRVVLPYGTCVFLGIDGEVEVPRKGDEPEACYLAYGSSITHGSLALGTPHTYPFRIAQELKCDSLNLGFAGTAHLEKAMAEYIVSRKDWTFASVEMGINMLGSFTEKEFEQRVDTFTSVLAADPRPVFATSLFMTGEEGGREEAYREIVRRYASQRLIFTDGLELLGEPWDVAGDLVHPSVPGIEKIVRTWTPVMAGRLGK